MIRTFLLSLLTLGLCCGVTCSIDVPGDGDDDGVIIGSTQTALDRADATITIADEVDQISAVVTARIVDSRNRVVRLRDSQAVRVNGTTLSGPRPNGDYTAVITSAGSYTIEVQEPTRGVERTTATPVADFQITSPGPGAGASLSGFSVEWSGGDGVAQVELVLRQIAFGSEVERTYGPFADTGRRDLAAEDLRDFVQGAPLELTVAKLAYGFVAGFREGTYEVRLEAGRVVDPRP